MSSLRFVIRRMFRRSEINSRAFSYLGGGQPRIFPSNNGQPANLEIGRHNEGNSYRLLKLAAVIALASGSVFAIRSYYDDITKYFQSRLFVHAAKKKKQEAAPPKPSLTSRELRFLNFASIEHEGQIFMTPRDFLDSVTQVHARDRKQRRDLSEDGVKKILKKTPPFSGGSKELFRHLNDNGLISYTEYLFLLCVLTKPTSGFRIAFNMFDTDGNQKVDKKEFLVIQALILLLRAGGKLVEFDPYLDSVPAELLKMVSNTNLQLRKACKNQLETGACDHDLETVFASSRREKRELQLRKYEQSIGAEVEHDEDEKAPDAEAKHDKQPAPTTVQHPSVWDKTEHMMETMQVQDTTLLVHFFGRRGRKTLAFDDFRKFTEDLQTEVLEIEFSEFSRGKPTITEAEFATILLRYTVSRPEAYKLYMDRVKEKIPDSKGITFDQFRQFCQFLTCLDDFTIAVKLYTFADMPVSQAEFARAVKVSTGHALDPYVVDTVFQIFDVNNDGRLSYSEFIGVMRDRLHRGFRTHTVERQGWDGFKQCIRTEMKRY